MTDWKFAQHDPAEELALVHHFSVKKIQGEQDVEFIIAVREFVTPRDPSMPFFAQADKQTNQKVAPYTPTGWGRSVLEALGHCLDEIRRFPYEPNE